MKSKEELEGQWFFEFLRCPDCDNSMCISGQIVRRNCGGRVRFRAGARIVTPKPDPQTLAAAVRHRFGDGAFSRRVRDILAPLLRDSAEPTLSACARAA